MQEIPFIVLLIPYLFMIVVGGIFLFFNIFHLWRYGIEGIGTSALIALYILLFLGVALGSWVFLSGFAWGETFSFSSILPHLSRSSFGL